MSSTVKPFPRTKPWAALEKFPSASKAIFLEGPLKSSVKSVCWSAKPSTRTAKRRGFENV